MIVRCKRCGGLSWAWMLKDHVEYDSCRICGGREFEKITGYEEHYTQAELWDLWELFGDVSVNDLDETEDQFLFFPAGTDRMEIWNWFDEKYDSGVYKLMEDVEE